MRFPRKMKQLQSCWSVKILPGVGDTTAAGGRPGGRHFVPGVDSFLVRSNGHRWTALRLSAGPPPAAAQVTGNSSNCFILPSFVQSSGATVAINPPSISGCKVVSIEAEGCFCC